MDEKKGSNISRRNFVRSAAAAGALAGSFPYVVRGALEEGPIKVGVVGCGGRGSGAMINCVDADKAVKITALADVFKDRLDGAVNKLKGKGQEVPEKNRFLGFDAFEKLIATDVDLVILATPPHFRPEHLAACVAAGKHVFMEKPVAVDAPGIRSIIASGEEAKSKRLGIVAGTQRRHQKPYIEIMKRIHGGEAGDIVSGQCYWNQSQLWYRQRKPEWNTMEWMIRDWVNWSWLSGDHVVEQHVHNIDIINWAIGAHPLELVAFGGRHRRVTGDQFDCFSADLTYPKGVHVHSMCRQINGCTSNVSERVVGTKGTALFQGSTGRLNKHTASGGRTPYEQEHVDLIASIRADKPLNEAQNVAWATMTAIMIRNSAYSGKKLKWSDEIKSNRRLGPKEYKWGDLPDIARWGGKAPTPGRA